MLAPQLSRLGSPVEPQAVNSLQPREEEVFRARGVLRRRVRAREYDKNRKNSAGACHPPTRLDHEAANDAKTARRVVGLVGRMDQQLWGGIRRRRRGRKLHAAAMVRCLTYRKARYAALAHGALRARDGVDSMRPCALQGSNNALSSCASPIECCATISLKESVPHLSQHPNELGDCIRD